MTGAVTRTLARTGQRWKGGCVTENEPEAAFEVPSLDVVRRTHRTIEPYHAIVYFAPEAAAAYEAAGVTGPGGYFASRAAAMGAVPASVVSATFFNFEPTMVARSLEGVWDDCTPDALLEARLAGIDRALRTHLGDEVLGSAEMRRAAELLRGPAEEATRNIAGRPLFAAHAALPWPEAPHLALWHAITLLREFRGDAHVAALLTAGLDGLDAIVIHAATGNVPAAFLKLTRGWSDDQWDEDVELLRATGWLAPDEVDGNPVLSEEGAMLREEIEIATDRGSAVPWAALGEEGCAELRGLVRPWSRILADAMFAGISR